MTSTFEQIEHLQNLWRIAQPADQLAEVRSQGESLRREVKRRGSVEAVRTFDLVQFPYPMHYGLRDAILAPYPYLMMRHAMNIVQFLDAQGVRRTLLFNPTEYELGREAPFFKNLARKYGEFISNKLLSKRFGTALGHLQSVGLSPEDVDYIAFDHWHVQDLRPLLGTLDGQFSPLYPRAQMIVQRPEVETLQKLHPMQAPWYVRDALLNADLSRLLVIDGSVWLGQGVALIATPGHTLGNQTLVLNLGQGQGGLYTISENGVCPDAYRPEASHLPGLQRHTIQTGQEVVLNGNSLELTLQQYASMILEKTLADESPDDPNFLNTCQSSPFVPSLLTPGISPSFIHPHISAGLLQPTRSPA